MAPPSPWARDHQTGNFDAIALCAHDREKKCDVTLRITLFDTLEKMRESQCVADETTDLAFLSAGLEELVKLSKGVINGFYLKGCKNPPKPTGTVRKVVPQEQLDAMLDQGPTRQ